MDFRIRGRKLSYQSYLFLLLLGFSWVMVGCFVVYQYHREKQYKIDKLNGQLQIFNRHLIDVMERDSAGFVVSPADLPMAGTRVSVISADGRLIFDNTLDSLPGENHLHRPEIAAAVRAGSGYTVRRHSASTNNTYFYSATSRGGVIVRSAVPYSVTLMQVLDADRTFLWFMLAVTLVASVAGYFATRRIGRTISRLNRFAEQAEKGERIEHVYRFPHDELGSISTHIVRLYARLQRTMRERDREHERALHEQQEKVRIKRQLTNNISHELKTPVASIRLLLETIMEHPEIPEEKKAQFISQCHAQTDRLTNLLNDISSITRMEEGAEAIEKETLNLADVVRECVESAAPALERSGITPVLDIPAEIPMVGNRGYLVSLFRNLLDNAAAYSGADRLEIAFHGERNGKYNITVSDNGCGIPYEHLERIFERFYRIDKGRSRQLGGTGLGLSIVRNAVHLHGGVINASNLRGGGLRFTFTLSKDPS